MAQARMYADVVMNGERVNLSVRANNVDDAKNILEKTYKGLSQILDISSVKPVNNHVTDKMKTRTNYNGKRQSNTVSLWGGRYSHVRTY